MEGSRKKLHKKNDKISCIIVDRHAKEIRVCCDENELIKDFFLRIWCVLKLDMCVGWLEFLPTNSNGFKITEKDMYKTVKDFGLFDNIKLYYKKPAHDWCEEAFVWSSYIACCSIRSFDTRVNSKIEISICFKPYSFFGNYAINLYHVLTTTGKYYENRWVNYLPKNEKPYTWTDYESVGRIMIIELKRNIKTQKDLENIRYNGPNIGYHGGETCSWQRYTNVLPIPVHMQTGNELLRLIPKIPLKRNTW